MCKWYCLSDGPTTNLQCLHCGCRYCGACLRGEAGKMESLVKCARCGKKPRTKANNERSGWKNDAINTANSIQPFANHAQSSPMVARVKDDDHVFVDGLRTDAPAKPTKAPSSSSKPSIFDKLTDASLYTGSHKHRFDEEGKGRGLAGRDSVAKGTGHIPIGSSLSSSSSSLSSPGRSSLAQTGSSMLSPKSPSTLSSARAKTPSKSPSSSSNGQHRSIFDKLTDTSLYTGAHKQRFDASGRGRGMAGRDAASGISYDGSSGVGDLSQITRSNLR